MKAISIKNGQRVALSSIATVSYTEFFDEIVDLLRASQDCHCVNYYAYKINEGLKFICCIADDKVGEIYVLSHVLASEALQSLASITKEVFAMHIFEREICENFDVDFIGHPWPKPVRYAFDRADKNKHIYNYPFFNIEGDAVHEIGVGPIHAGVIEPGHFRYQCNGEYVHHLEIQLGWQHRGVEHLFITKNKLIQRTVLAESIAGDTVVGHTLAFVYNMEAMYDIKESPNLALLRSLALELERISIHVGDLGAMATDVAYQLGSNVFGALRTPAINHFQFWCGNRFAKGLIRTGYMGYKFTAELVEKYKKMLFDFEEKYVEMADEMFSLPSVMSRFEKTGEVTQDQALLIGAVGMAARITNLPRDIRNTHPFSYYKTLKYQPMLLESGDVWARAKMRDLEIRTSIAYMRDLINDLEQYESIPCYERIALEGKKMQPDSFSITLVEGWRGEICHCAITDHEGELKHYKVKDPSMHNWLALALALRENEISDFPINNKSFDLSYCGHDL